MAQIDNQSCVRRWVRHVSSKDGLRRTGADRLSYIGGSVRADEADRLIYQLSRNVASDGQVVRSGWGPVELGRYIRERKLYLLNGDGFDSPHATRWQTDLRGQVQRALGIDTPDTLRWRTSTLPDDRSLGINELGSRPTGRRFILVPFMALNAARIDFDTIEPVDVTQDHWEVVRHRVPAPPAKDSKLWKAANDNAPQQRWAQRWQMATKDGIRYRRRQDATTRWRNRRTGRTTMNHPGYEDQDAWTMESVWEGPSNRLVQVMGESSFSPLGVRQAGRNNWHLIGETRGRDPQTQNGWTSSSVGEGEWSYDERAHHLGASVFTAVSLADGERHTYLSAFDEEEPGQMYFLAQLPDGTEAKTYPAALAALAPPLVHAARRKKVPVYRQGDVFAVQTKLDDEQVYALARTRVRREVALPVTMPHQIAAIVSGSADAPPRPAKGEVGEALTCHCGTRHPKVRVGNGQRAKRALMIYGTGHTADEVVVGKKGDTYIRGRLYHDPHLEEAGRRREHVDVVLGADPTKWFLAVRNTVPRRAADTSSDSSAPAETAAAPTREREEVA